MPPFGGHADQIDRITARVYDAAHRVVSEIQLAGDLALASQREYDILGMLVSETDPRGLVTSHQYASNGLVRSVTLPGGLVRTTVHDVDGRVRSLSEDGALRTLHEYGAGNDGTQWSKTFAGPGGTSSPSWSKTTSDFLGRSIREERPMFGGGIATNTLAYNIKGQPVRQSNIQGAQSTVSLSEYDDLGQQVRSALDVNQNGVIDLAGPDRVSDSIRRYVQRDGDWYTENLSLVYPTASTVPVTNAITRSSAGGLSCGCATLKNESVDILGNITVSETVMDPAHKLVTKNVRSPASTNAATSVTHNGLTVESASATGVKTTYTHDALGRQVSAFTVSGSRSVGSVTHFREDGQVDWIMDAASNVTSFAYDSAGRRVAVTDALSNTTHTAYDSDGRVLATCGFQGTDL